MPSRAEQLWGEALERIVPAVPTYSLELYLRPGRALGLKEDRLLLGFPEDLVGWVMKRYASLLGETVRAVDESLAGVRITKLPATAGEGEGYARAGGDDQAA